MADDIREDIMKAIGAQLAQQELPDGHEEINGRIYKSIDGNSQLGGPTQGAYLDKPDAPGHPSPWPFRRYNQGKKAFEFMVPVPRDFVGS